MEPRVQDFLIDRLKFEELTGQKVSHVRVLQLVFYQVPNALIQLQPHNREILLVVRLFLVDNQHTQ